MKTSTKNMLRICVNDLVELQKDLDLADITIYKEVTKIMDKIEYAIKHEEKEELKNL